tara:strand:- start:277 stop:819 length:543 start_codon:yes stop_codon:yes gene_type:complete
MGCLKPFVFYFLLLIQLPINAQEAEKVESQEFDNMYKVSQTLYRSEQPSKKGFGVIDSMEIRTILSLRNRVSDRFRARKSQVQLERLRINSWRMTYDDIVSALIIIRDAEKPVLVHCLHGSDRTGAIVAAYRMAFDGWSKEEAINEFLEEKYGYHEKWFPDILNLLKELDIDRLKTELNK